MSHFRLLHFSDLHLGVLINHHNRWEAYRDKMLGRISDVTWTDMISNPKTLFKPGTYSDYARLRLAKFCEKKQNDFDAAVVTGDLATTGRDRDLQPAVDYFSKTVGKKFVQSDQFNTLSVVDRSFFVMPGNHDRYMHDFPLPASRNFDEKFSKIYPGNDVYSFTRSKNNKRIGVVFGDFCIAKISDIAGFNPKKAISNLYGHGIAYKSVIEKMIAETQELRKKSPGIFVLWAVHFAPFDCGNDLEFRDYGNLVLAAKNSGIKLILCGHTHDQKKFVDEDLTIYCAGSVMCADREDDHKLHIIDLKFAKSGVMLRRENFVLRRNSRTYVNLSTD